MVVLSFCVQESAKAALKMKDCQMTDHTTQTEHMGPEVRHTQTTHTIFFRSVRHKHTSNALCTTFEALKMQFM